MKAKTITVMPSVDVSLKIDELASTLRTSRAGFCNLAIEFVLPLLETGRMAVINGRLRSVDGEEVKNG